MTRDIAPLVDALQSGVGNVRNVAQELLRDELQSDADLVEILAKSVSTIPEPARPTVIALLGAHVHRDAVSATLRQIALDPEQPDDARARAIRALGPRSHEDEVAQDLLAVRFRSMGHETLQALLEVAKRMPLSAAVSEFLTEHALRDDQSSAGANARVAALQSLYASRAAPEEQTEVTLRLLPSSTETADAIALIESIREALRDLEDQVTFEVTLVLADRIYPALDQLQQALGTTVASHSALDRLRADAGRWSYQILVGADLAVAFLADTENAAGTLARLAKELSPLAAKFVL